MQMSERTNKSFKEALNIAREHNLRHYILGNNHILVVDDKDEIKMFKNLERR